MLPGGNLSLLNLLGIEIVIIIQIDKVIKYILSQERHHKKRPFKEEYLEMLEKNEIIYGNEYLFEFFNDINE